MSNGILSTRMMMPKPRRGAIARRRLFNMLEGMAHCRLTLIKGGAGCGKTTLMASYILEKQMDARWLSLDGECNDMALFWGYGAQLLTGAGAMGIEEYRQAGKGKGGSQELIKSLINILDRQREIYWVLDDFHLIDNKDLIASLDYFIANMPDNYHLVLLTRQPPPLRLAVLEMRGQLLQVEEAALRLAPGEGVDFLRQTLNLSYPQAEMEALAERADGWIGGLQLLAASGRGSQTALTGREGQLLFNYIEEEIFSRLPAEEQGFLVATSPAAYLSGPLAAAVAEGVDYATLLKRLLGKNLMLVCLDEQQGFYRCHPLLKDFLLSRFSQLEVSLQKALYRASAMAFLQAGDADEGLRLLVEGEDYPLVMDTLLALPPGDVYLHYLGRLPQEVAATNFDIAFQKMLCHYIRGEENLSKQLYESALKSLQGDERIEAFAGLSFLFNERQFILAEGQITGGVKAMEACPLTKSLILIKNAVVLFYLERFPEALEAIEQSGRYAHPAGGGFIRYFSTTLASQIYEEMGLFNQALAAQEEAWGLIETSPLLREHQKPSYYVTVVGVLMKQMRLKEAEALLARCRPEAEERGGQIKLSYDYNWIEYLFLSGNEEEGAKCLAAFMAGQGEDILAVAYLLKYLFACGRMSTSAQARYLGAFEKGGEGQSINSRLLYTRLLAAKGENEAALLVLRGVQVAAKKQQSAPRVAEASLIKLAIVQQVGKPGRQPAALFREALYYACDNQILTPFLLNKEAVARFIAEEGGGVYASLTKGEKVFYNQVEALTAGAGNGLLTPREQEIICAMAQGLTNEAIGKKLFISLPTVKTHSTSIYRKLGVKSRVMAVEKARQLGLL